jgi:urease accessory protein
MRANPRLRISRVRHYFSDVSRELAPMVGASLDAMERDSRRMRGERPFVFTNLKTGQGPDTVVRFVIERGMVRCAAAS